MSLHSHACISSSSLTAIVAMMVTLVCFCVCIGDLPLVINEQTSLSAGQHSVVITASDPLGYTVLQTVDYILAEAERTNS